MPATADDGGWVEVRYGEDGNALAVTVHGRCGDPDENEIPLDCRSGGGLGGFEDEEKGGGTDDPEEAVDLSCAYSCAVEQHFTYAWDEVNRIAHARRYDRDRTSGPADWQLAVEQRYLYDASNQRTVKTTTFRGVESGAERTALYVYPGDFERRGLQATLDRTSYEAISGDTETQYGVGGARIVWRTGTRDDGLDRDQRITIALTDLIQSTTAVIDMATGELVETGTYYANGARETYRSNETETVAPEPMGFTGKEADEEVGLTYFGHRYLMAHLGRWASPDPLQTHAVGGGEALNGYHYVAGNMLQARDPAGLDADMTVEQQGHSPELQAELRSSAEAMAADMRAQAREDFGLTIEIDSSDPGHIRMRLGAFDKPGYLAAHDRVLQESVRRADSRGLTGDARRAFVQGVMRQWETDRAALQQWIGGADVERRIVLTTTTRPVSTEAERELYYLEFAQGTDATSLRVNPFSFFARSTGGILMPSGAGTAGMRALFRALPMLAFHEGSHQLGCGGGRMGGGCEGRLLAGQETAPFEEHTVDIVDQMMGVLPGASARETYLRSDPNSQVNRWERGSEWYQAPDRDTLLYGVQILGGN